MINSGDTAWLLMSTALVMLMIPGLALFYGGMVRGKNVLSTLMMSFVLLGVIGVLWVLYGYSLSFGSDIGGLIGGLEFLGLNGVGQEPSDTYATTVPHLSFMMFQGMFAIIAVALWTVDRCCSGEDKIQCLPYSRSPLVHHRLLPGYTLGVG